MLKGAIKGGLTALAPQSVTGAVTGTPIDTAGYEEVFITLAAGAIVATGTLDVIVQESDLAAGPWTDITGAVFPQRTHALENTALVGRLRTALHKRWIQVIATQATAAAEGMVSVNLVGKNFVAEPQTYSFDV
jgi:hypothetical protein